ncbi:MAG: hypothetical protein ACI8UX_001935, partial [Psychromonas sp.]
GKTFKRKKQVRPKTQNYRATIAISSADKSYN